ncbi:Protein of unknown function [Leuconostoc citreum LBAE C11]|nr:Protein of unknown function [Leuconostoc citreum LBAE C11]
MSFDTKLILFLFGL